METELCVGGDLETGGWGVKGWETEGARTVITPLFCKHNPTAMLRGLPGGQIGVGATSQKVPVISGQEAIYGVY